MAHVSNGKEHWDDDDKYYSSSYSDDSPILSYRHEKRRYVPYASPSPPEDRERRSTFSMLAKFCLFCVAMILFCVLMYIPVYSKVNYHIPRGIVAGWSIDTNRDTKIYVQPNNVTTVHEPKDICNSNNKKLFLLIIVCSSTENFARRKAIRETWGNYQQYYRNLKIFKQIKDKYKNYDYKTDLYTVDIKLLNNTNESIPYAVENTTQKRSKRDISSFNQLLPALAKALKEMNLSKTEEVPEKRFEDEDNQMLSEFDMNKEIGTQTENVEEYKDYDYESNVMKIPPRGYEDTESSHYLPNVLSLFKQSKDFDKIKDVMVENGNTEPGFKVVFLLGLPGNNRTQKKIEEEVNMYGDVIQEGFVDSYNNLTLKSIMMLKWVTNKCNDNVRYILKTDDDMYINVPNLMLNLENRSQEYDKKVAEGYREKEYLLIGDLISGARPVLNLHSKWYSPKYMYSGRVYPRYLSGTGYVMSSAAARALYKAALSTHYFHLEDIFITGMCSSLSSPRIPPRDDPLFSYHAVGGAGVGRAAVCCAHSQVTAHHVPPNNMLTLHSTLWQISETDRCERIRLTQVRRERLRRLMAKRKKAQNLTQNAT